MNNSARPSQLYWIFLFCVGLVLLRLFTDAGYVYNQSFFSMQKVEDLISDAPIFKTTAYIDTVSYAGQIDAEIIKASSKLEPKHQKYIKELINFSLGDEIERENISAEEIHELLSEAISEAQQSYNRLGLDKQKFSLSR